MTSKRADSPGPLPASSSSPAALLPSGSSSALMSKRAADTLWCPRSVFLGEPREDTWLASHSQSRRDVITGSVVPVVLIWLSSWDLSLKKPPGLLIVYLMRPDVSFCRLCLFWLLEALAKPKAFKMLWFDIIQSYKKGARKSSGCPCWFWGWDTWTSYWWCFCFLVLGFFFLMLLWSEIYPIPLIYLTSGQYP